MLTYAGARLVQTAGPADILYHRSHRDTRLDYHTGFFFVITCLLQCPHTGAGFIQSIGLLTYFTTYLPLVSKRRAPGLTQKGVFVFFSLLSYRALRCCLLQDTKCACFFFLLCCFYYRALRRQALRGLSIRTSKRASSRHAFLLYYCFTALLLLYCCTTLRRQELRDIHQHALLLYH
jgi:hypothetical protein